MTLRLLDFVYDVEYLPGHKNKVADFLSCSATMEEAPRTNGWEQHQVAFTVDQEAPISVQEWKTAYENDPDLSKVKTFISQG